MRGGALGPCFLLPPNDPFPDRDDQKRRINFLSSAARYASLSPGYGAPYGNSGQLFTLHATWTSNALAPCANHMTPETGVNKPIDPTRG